MTVLAAHAWNSGDGPTALFQWAVRWLREHDVLLPGVTTLTRLVARERDAATQRLYETLAQLPTRAGGAAGSAAGGAGGQADVGVGAVADGPVEGFGPGMEEILTSGASVLSCESTSTSMGSTPSRPWTPPTPPRAPPPPDNYATPRSETRRRTSTKTAPASTAPRYVPVGREYGCLRRRPLAADRLPHVGTHPVSGGGGLEGSISMANRSRHQAHAEPSASSRALKIAAAVG